jgi:hypothetical protein
MGSGAAWNSWKLTPAHADGPAWQKTWLNRRGFIFDRSDIPAAVARRNRLWSNVAAIPPVISHRYASVPHWVPALLFASLPAYQLRRRGRKRRHAGHCPGCGYDLTGNVSGVCPECGIEAPTPA